MPANDRTKYLYLNSRDEFLRLNISRIAYFESDGNLTHIILTNKLRATVGISLLRMLDILSENLKDKAGCFARIGKRHIINLSYVYQIAILKQRLVLSDGENFEYQLSISKDALKSLRDMYVSRLCL